MTITGVIAEYNPFHNGHLYHLKESRKKTDADYIIAVMSGDFVQRGAPAVLSKYDRTRMALFCGADLVLELPAAYATASAEFFALGGIRLLNDLGAVSHVSFGVEPLSLPDPESCTAEDILRILSQAADCLSKEPPLFQETLRQSLKEGLSFPSARAKALLTVCKDALPAQALSSPNNILGLEYLKALRACHSHIRPLGILRSGSGYHDTSLSSGRFASATGIRTALAGHLPVAQLDGVVPPAVLSLLKEQEQVSFPVDEADFSAMLRYRLLMLSGMPAPAEVLASFCDMSPQLARRMLERLPDFADIPQFTDLLKTRNLTRTRISRCLTHILLDMKDAPFQALCGSPFPVPYARILGFRKEAAPLLSILKKHSSIPLITKTADAKRILTDFWGTDAKAALWLWQQDILAADIYETAVCARFHRMPRNEYTSGLILLS